VQCVDRAAQVVVAEVAEGGKGRGAAASQQVSVGDEDDVALGEALSRIECLLAFDQLFWLVGVVHLDHALELSHTMPGFVRAVEGAQSFGDPISDLGGDAK